MGKYAKNVVDQAVSLLGCNEYDGTHKKIIDIYNSHKPLARGYKVKYTDAWCATFVSAVAIKLGYTDIIPTECGCDKMIELFKRLNSWDDRDSRVPNPGDIIFYDWQDLGYGDCLGSSDHVGIVEKVSGNIITVIEGNYNNSVKRREIAVDGKYIRGYGVPKYDKEKVAETKDLATVAKEVIDGKWGNGSDRKAKLVAAGYDYDEVQKEVNRQLNKPTNNLQVDTAKSYKKSKAGTYKIVNATGGLRLRTGASTSRSIIEVMDNGSKVICYGYYTGSWLYVISENNKTGFCHIDYLKKM